MSKSQDYIVFTARLKKRESNRLKRIGKFYNRTQSQQLREFIDKAYEELFLAKGKKGG